jgi:hypothetical protein
LGTLKRRFETIVSDRSEPPRLPIIILTTTQLRLKESSPKSESSVAALALPLPPPFWVLDFEHN